MAFAIWPDSAAPPTWLLWGEADRLYEGDLLHVHSSQRSKNADDVLEAEPYLQRPLKERPFPMLRLAIALPPFSEVSLSPPPPTPPAAAATSTLSWRQCRRRLRRRGFLGSDFEALSGVTDRNSIDRASGRSEIRPGPSREIPPPEPPATLSPRKC